MKRVIVQTAAIAAVLAMLTAILGACAAKKTETDATAVPGASEKAVDSNTQQDAAIGTTDAETALKKAQELAAKYRENENPIAVIIMENGDPIVMELYEKTAPQTVKNFISLADSGFYDGLTFHRIDPDFMIQGGDPDGNGTGGPGYEIFGEFTKNGFQNDLSHERGVVSMARRTPPNTAGSQFFICVKDSAFLDGNYAAFGRVLEGMETVDAIANAEANGETPVSPRVMQLVRIAEQGELHKG